MDGLCDVEGLLSTEGGALGAVLKCSHWHRVQQPFFPVTNWTVTQCFDSPRLRLKL